LGINYLAYSGNNLLNVSLPDGSAILHAPKPLPGLSRAQVPGAVRTAFEHPVEMPPLKELVNGNSKVLVCFDDNCQPFPPTPRPDYRELMIEALLPMLYEAGVSKSNIKFLCAVALHRKMKRHELEYMVGPRVMSEFYPAQLDNFDAEAPEDLSYLGETEKGEPVEVSRFAVEADLVIYLDTVQIPLNGGHKSVAVGLGTYRTIAAHHSPHMTKDVPHVMQPDGSCMHASIERISRVVSKHTRIMVLELAMNNATYPAYVNHLGIPDSECNAIQLLVKRLTPASLSITPEPVRRAIFKSIKSENAPMEINAGSIDAVHVKTVAALAKQLTVQVPRQYDTVMFGLPDLSPYSIDARINPVLVLSDVLGYLFNWFYNKPLVRAGGSVIILNPIFEVFHPEYHAAYEKFWNEVLPRTTDPMEMHMRFQQKFAEDEQLRDAYRHRFAHHGFHPFTVWYWATYPLKYLSQVIVVGPKNGASAKRLGVKWAPSTDAALEMARQHGKDDVAAVTVPPFFYLNVG
jgi:hypothetical protein